MQPFRQPIRPAPLVRAMSRKRPASALAPAAPPRLLCCGVGACAGATKHWELGGGEASSAATPSAGSAASAAISKATATFKESKAIAKLQKTRYHGSFLQKYFHQAWGGLTHAQKTKLKTNISPATSAMASMCSGSGLAEIVHDFVFSSVGECTNLLYSCECVPWKQQHLQATVHENAEGKSACLFTDMALLSSGYGECVVHHHRCVVPRQTFMLVAGYSCKGMSALKGTSREDVLPSESGSSGKTAAALIAFLKRFRIPVTILENVEEMAKEEGQSRNVAYLHSALRSAGYMIMTKLLWASCYGLPQARKRAWSVVVHMDTFGFTSESAREHLKAVFKLVEQLKKAPPSLDEFLLKPDHDKVRAELHRRQETMRGDKKEDPSFLGLHQKHMAGKGVCWRTLAAPADVQTSPWFATLPPREKEIVGYALALHPNMLGVDAGQRIDRAAILTGEHMNTITPGAKIFMTWKWGAQQKPLNRLLLGWEALMLQGYPVQALKGHSLSDPQMFDLAGNAFPSTILAAIYLSTYIVLPCHLYNNEQEEEEATGSHDVDIDPGELFNFLTKT